ncbi:GlcG/HbpS family heme-binding protein [Ectobacillus ponti]|uniref:Heme-binding protein n=1 Tax=Ectobacillus ponti TaxID=2961894 RepID=A0AA41XCQ6_9BACI|nr:heme-binding protein [Ectobacillus ponti]MCP8970500.1 heme-binding protein [Ectobacillus ponti]
MKVYEMKPILTMDMAAALAQRACEKAGQLGVAVNAAVVDGGGNLQAFLRMDGAPLLSIGIAQDKAYTAAAFGLPTSDWYPLISSSPELLHGIVHTPRLTVFSGGVPIRIQGQLAGGIGVSGGTVEEDAQCADYALELLEAVLAAE